MGIGSVDIDEKKKSLELLKNALTIKQVTDILETQDEVMANSGRRLVSSPHSKYNRVVTNTRPLYVCSDTDDNASVQARTIRTKGWAPRQGEDNQR